MPRLSIEEVLRSLTQEEVTILFWKCKGLTYQQMISPLWNDQTRIYRGVESITEYMGNVYEKMGINHPDLHHTQRMKLIKKLYCPALMKMTGDNPENLKNWPQAVEPPQPSNLTIMLVKQDDLFEQEEELEKEKERVENEKQKIDQALLRIPPVINMPTPPRRRLQLLPWSLVLILGCIAIFLFITNTYVNQPLLSLLFPSRTPSPTVTQSPTITITPTITKTPTKTRTPTRTATGTITPTPTETNTPIPSPTNFPLPFADEFNASLSPLWKIYGSDPSIVDGNLTTADSTWLYAGDMSWKNYTVSVLGYRGNWFALNNFGGQLEIGVRVQEIGNMIVVSCGSGTSSVITRKGGVDTEVPGAVYTWAPFWGFEPPNFVIIVTDSRIRINVYGQTGADVTLTGTNAENYSKGGIAIHLGSGMPISYVRVTPIE